MAVFRVERNKGYTVMSNHHLRNKELSLLTRSGGVKKFVVLGGKGFSSVRISPNPISERILDCLLFLLCQGSFFFIEDTLLLTICIFNRIIDTNILQIQRFLQNPICVGSLCTVGDI